MQKNQRRQPIPVDPETDLHRMRHALVLARRAFSLGEVPVGAVITRGDKVIAEAWNRRETGRCAILHAETEAILKACHMLGGWRLPGCTLYVTLEPCPMCAGAIINARIPRVVYGCADSEAGAFGSVLDLRSYPLNHKPLVEHGLCEAECRALMQEFFLSLRAKRKK